MKKKEKASSKAGRNRVLLGIKKQTAKDSAFQAVREYRLLVIRMVGRTAGDYHMHDIVQEALLTVQRRLDEIPVPE